MAYEVETDAEIAANERAHREESRDLGYTITECVELVVRHLAKDGYPINATDRAALLEALGERIVEAVNFEPDPDELAEGMKSATWAALVADRSGRG